MHRVDAVGQSLSGFVRDTARVSTPPTQLPRLFVGSTSEASEIAYALQEVLEARDVCEVTVWSRLFQAGDMTLDSLLKAARSFDFAVLVATADDVTTSRGSTVETPRDNVILELGIFMGALGRKRAYVLTDEGPVKLPTDLLGYNRLIYTKRRDGDKAAALNAAVGKIKLRVEELGPTEWNRPSDGSVHVHGTYTAPRPDKQQQPSTTPRKPSEERQLDAELEQLQKCAMEQGWAVKRSPHALRLSKPGHHRQTLQVGDPIETRRKLRSFVAVMRADGLRVTHTLRTLPAELNPWS